MSALHDIVAAHQRREGSFLQRISLELCRFSAAGMTVSPRAPRAGGRKAPRQEIAGWERRRCRNYGDFAAGSGVDVVERGGKVGNFATRHVRELNCERVMDRLCNAILRF